MRVRTIGVLSLVGVAISITPIWAGPVSVQSLSADQRAAALTQLEAQRHQVSKQMLMPPYNKGPILIHNMDRYSKLSDLIDRLQGGQAVAPDEVDRALQPTN